MNSANEQYYLQCLAKRLKQLRKAKGFANYEQFAYTYNIGRAQYGRYETGSNITFVNLIKLVKIHGMSLEEFFSEGFDEGEA